MQPYSQRWGFLQGCRRPSNSREESKLARIGEGAGYALNQRNPLTLAMANEWSGRAKEGIKF